MNNNFINSQKISQTNNKAFDNFPNKNNSLIKKISVNVQFILSLSIIIWLLWSYIDKENKYKLKVRHL